MSGQPSAKPAPGPAKSVAPKPAVPTAKGPAAKGAAVEKPAATARPRSAPEPEKSDEDGDPFEVDPLAHKQAVQVSVKQAKGRTTEVKCPMCETVGYIAAAQAGKDVKCCNPACKLPIFKSPKLPPIVQAEPEKPKGLSGTMLTLIGLVSSVLIGAGVYFFVLQKKPVTVLPPINTNPVVAGDPAPDTKLPENVIVVVTKKEVTTVAEIRQLSLEELLKVSIQHDMRSRPFGLQLAAEAQLIVGDLTGAKGLIAKMGAAGAQYAVEPLSLLALKQLEAGDEAGAKASLEEAVKLSSKLPDVGRPPLDAVAILSAALVQFDRSVDAVQLLNRYSQKDGEVRAVLSELWRASLDQKTFDFAQESSLSHLEVCGKPLWVATTIHLCRHGKWDQALKWARSAPDQVTQDAALAACAGMLASQQLRRPAPEREAQLQAAIESAELTAKVRMRVAAAEVRFLAGDKSITTTTVAEIEQLLANTIIPPAAEPPGIKDIYDSKGVPFAGMPDPGPGTSLSMAFADVADLQMKLGNLAGGWSTQTKAMEMLRSVSPSPAIAQHLVDQCTSNGEVVKNQLNTALQLGNNTPKQQLALSQYRVQCMAILKVANDRFAIQQTLLRRSIRYGLLAEVWQYVQDLEQGEMARIEPYRLRSTLLTDLFYQARSQGNEAFATKTWGEYTEVDQDSVRRAEATVGLLAATTLMARSGEVRTAAEKLKPLYVGAMMDRHVIDRHVLGLVSELAGKSIESSYTYIQRLADPTIREDSLRLLAGLSITQQKGPVLWKLIAEDREIQATDRAAAYLGFLEGIQAVDEK